MGRVERDVAGQFVVKGLIGLSAEAIDSIY